MLCACAFSTYTGLSRTVVACWLSLVRRKWRKISCGIGWNVRLWLADSPCRVLRWVMTKTTCQPPGSACQVQTRVLGGDGEQEPHCPIWLCLCLQLWDWGQLWLWSQLSTSKNALWASPRWWHHSTSGAHPAFQGWSRGPDPQYSPSATSIPAGSVSQTLQGVWDPVDPDPQGTEPQRGGSKCNMRHYWPGTFWEIWWGWKAIFPNRTPG